MAYGIGISSASITTYPYVTISSGNIYQEHRRRLKCAYCDCISSKESGTCENCGAPLIEEEY